MEKRQVTVLGGHTGYIKSIAISSDNQYIISGSYDNTVRIWNIKKKRQKIVLTGHENNVISIAITYDNKYVISCSKDKTIRVWNPLKRKLNYQNNQSLLNLKIDNT